MNNFDHCKTIEELEAQNNKWIAAENAHKIAFMRELHKRQLKRHAAYRQQEFKLKQAEAQGKAS